MDRYFANDARTLARASPDDFPIAIGLLSDRDKPGSIIGLAHGAGWIGGW